MNTEFSENISTERRNVILLGDSIGDPNMSHGISHDNHVLKIGFLNYDVGFIIIMIDLITLISA